MDIQSYLSKLPAYIEIGFLASCARGLCTTSRPQMAVQHAPCAASLIGSSPVAVICATATLRFLLSAAASGAMLALIWGDGLGAQHNLMCRN